MAEDVKAGDSGGAPGGREVAGEHAYGCCFAGAVGAKEAYDFALVDGEGNILNGEVATVSFGEVVDFDHDVPGERRYIFRWEWLTQARPTFN